MHQGDTREITQPPHDKSMYLVGRCIIIQHGDQGGCHITDHNPDDEEHDVILYLRREPDNQSQDTGSTGKGGDNDRQITADGQFGHHTEGSAEIEHDGSHSQVCTVADTQDRGTCQRVSKKRLQQ